jgi:hypothetical protein
LLACDADLRNQDVAAVPETLRLVETAGRLDGETRLGPTRDSARERDHVLEAVLVHRLGQPQRPVPVCAVEDDPPVANRVEPSADLGHRNVLRARDRA